MIVLAIMVLILVSFAEFAWKVPSEASWSHLAGNVTLMLLSFAQQFEHCKTNNRCRLGIYSSHMYGFDNGLETFLDLCDISKEAAWNFKARRPTVLGTIQINSN